MQRLGILKHMFSSIPHWYDVIERSRFWREFTAGQGTAKPLPLQQLHDACNRDAAVWTFGFRSAFGM
jgi:hypothetical protein